MHQQKSRATVRQLLMQGSPLLRTLLTTALLIVAALVLLRLTSASAAKPVIAKPVPEQQPVAPSTAATAVPFELVLSAPAAEIRLLDVSDKLLFQTAPETTTVSGSLSSRPASLILQIKWKDQSPGHRFARLSMEPPNESTLRQIFEGSGDLDEFWELPAAP